MKRTGLISRIAKRFRYFCHSERGNVTLFTTLAAIPFVAAVGAGVDYARISRETTALQVAVDSALLAIITSERSNLKDLTAAQKTARLKEIEAMAEEYLVRNYSAEQGNPNEVEAKVVIDGDVVTMTAEHELPMTLMSFLGTPLTKITIKSEAVREKEAITPVEIALVMDTTGSMGSTYMNQAKTAARNLLTTLYGGSKTDKKENPNLRVSLVPFAAAVRLNQNAYDFDLSWIDTTGASSVSRLNFSDSSWHNYKAWQSLANVSWNGCVEARPRGSAPFNYNVNDAPPVSGDTLFVPYFAPDEPTFSGSTGSPGYFDNSYINNSGTPNERTGMTSTISSSTNSQTYNSNASVLLDRQKNVNKYVNKTINTEANSDYGPWYNCAASAVVPMTYNRSKIEDGITAMSAAGNTLIPEGLAWGWRTLSPGAPFTKVEAGPTIAADTISPYNDKWKKVLVLMTDGENNASGGLNTLNGALYSAYGYAKYYSALNENSALSQTDAKNRFGVSPANAETALDDAMMELCKNIKATGITIYTVAFRVNSSTILKNLKNCASAPEYYSYASDGTELSKVFTTIGESVKATVVHLSK